MDFFARLGKTPFGKNAMPLVATGISFCYATLDLAGHDLFRNLLSAKSSSYRDGEFTDELQRLAIEVYDDVKSDLNKSVIDSTFFSAKPGPIRWFSSSLMDPISFGMIETRMGSSIAIPSYFNYRTKEDIPDDIFNVRSLRLFKNFSKPEEKEEIILEGVKSEKIIDLGEHSELKNEYADSILLSDNAKKYAIAKELFLIDSYRVLANFFLLSCSLSLPILMSRASVTRFKLADSHLNRRIPIYILSGLFGVSYFSFFHKVIRKYFDKVTDERVKAKGKLYEEGYVEYIAKRNQRLQVLDKIKKLDS